MGGDWESWGKLSLVKLFLGLGQDGQQVYTRGSLRIAPQLGE